MSLSTPSPTAANYRAAYQRRLPELMALSSVELLTINIDLPAAVATVFGALPVLRELRPEAARLGKFDMALFDSLEDHARAAACAHARWQNTTSETVDPSNLYKDAVQLRSSLKANVQIFTQRNLIDPRHLKTLTGRTGYRKVALDVLVMAQVLVDHWPVVQDKTPLTVADLDHAEDVAQRLVVASAEQQHTPPAFIEATSIRQRAFTLLVRSYNHARRAVTFLRWNEGDAEKVAPSLYRGRSGRGNRAKEDSLTPTGDDGAVLTRH